MNTKILILLMMLILLEQTVAMAAAVVTYAPFTTGFTVTITANIAGVPEAAMNFTGKIGSTIYPNGTKNGTNRWGYIYNTGSSSISFQMAASATTPNIILKVDAKPDMKHSFIVTSTPGHPSGTNWNGWRYVPYLGSANIFAVAKFDANAMKKFNIPVNVTAQ